MKSNYVVVLLSIRSCLLLVHAAPVSPPTNPYGSRSQHGLPPSHHNPINTGAQASSSSTSKSSWSHGVPTPSQRKVPYKPRKTSRFLTGTPRQQVEQMQYRLPPKGSDETEEDYQAKKRKRIEGLEGRKSTLLRKIIELEEQFGAQGEQEVTKQFNEWMQEKQRARNITKVRSALKRDDFTREEYDKMLQDKQQEDENTSAAWKASHARKKLAQHRFVIRQKVKQGDERSINFAKERMQRYGITDLSDGRKEGARKTVVRKALLIDPHNEETIQEAIKLGMDTFVQPASRAKASYQEYTNLKRQKIGNSEEGPSSAVTGLPQGQAGSSVQHSQQKRPDHNLIGPAQHASTEHKIGSSSNAKGHALPFDLNLEPPRE